jgi:cation/acetate symporter
VFGCLAVWFAVSYRFAILLVGTTRLPAPERWFGISPEGIGTLFMLHNPLVAWVVPRLTAAPPEHIRQGVESIRSPRGAGAATGHKPAPF